jgi:hypothetical protein
MTADHGVVKAATLSVRKFRRCRVLRHGLRIWYKCLRLRPTTRVVCIGRTAGRGDDGHSTADQVSHQRRQTIVLALQPMVFNRHVLTIDVTGFAKALSKRGCIPGTVSADPPLIHRQLQSAVRGRGCGQVALLQDSAARDGPASVRLHIPMDGFASAGEKRPRAAD